jgi:hypothetical protein
MQGARTKGEGAAMRISAFLALFMVLLLLWAGGFLVYHVTSFLIHLLLLFAVISLVIHLIRGGSQK